MEYKVKIKQAESAPYGAGQPRRWATYLIIPLVVAVVGLLAALVSQLRFDQIYPSADKRFDVTQASIATMHELCGHTHRDLGNIEECLREVQSRPVANSGFHNLSLPPVNEINPQAYPKFRDILNGQDLGHINKATAGDVPIVLSFDVPIEYFSINAFDQDPHVLLFTAVQEGRVCIADSCPYYLDQQDYLSLSFPLILKQIPEGSTHLPVSIVYAEDRNSTFGINFEQGLFIARSSDTRILKSTHKSLITGQSMMGALLAIALFLIALTMAFTWRQYVDYTAFALLTFFIACYLTRSAIAYDLEHTNWRMVSTLFDFLRVGMLGAACLYAVSTARISGRRFVALAIGVFVVAGLWATGTHLYKTSTDIVRIPTHVNYAIAYIQLVVPGLIALFAWRFSRAAQELSSKAKKRRQYEQSVVALGLALFALPHALWAWYHTQGLWTYNFFAFTPLATVPLFAAMIYTTHGVLNTRLQEYQIEMNRLSRLAAIGELAQMIAHDVRKPFSMLKTGLQMISRNTNDPATQSTVDRVGHEVEQSLGAVNAMLEDVMEVNRPASVQATPTALAPLVGNSLRPVAAKVLAKKLELEVELDHTRRPLLDAAKFQRVLTNLIDNAADATKAGGSVRIRTSDRVDGKSQQLVISVHNSDSYLSSEEQTSIFEPFYTSGKRGGVGLGLPIVKKIIDAHEGASLAIESQKSSGTSFIATVTASDEKDETNSSFDVATILSASIASSPSSEFIDAAGTAKKIRASLGHCKILMIDDESLYCDAAHILLMGVKGLPEACEFTACSGWEIDVLSFADFHLVICDIDLGLNDQDGLGVIAQIRAANPQALICAHTNRGFPEDSANAINAGADLLIPKPLTASHLVKLINMTVRKQQQDDQTAI